MSNDRRRRRKRYSVNTQFASFGDIAIQLVIFFILASHFAKEPSAKLELAKSEELKTLDTPKVLVVIDDRNRIFLNTEEVAKTGELQIEEACAELLEFVATRVEVEQA